MKILSIDPGTMCGITIYQNGKYTHNFSMHILDTKTILLPIIQSIDGNIQIVYEKIPSGLAGSLTVNFAANLIINEIKSKYPRKCKFHGVTPSTWQSWQKKQLKDKWINKDPKTNSIQHFKDFAPKSLVNKKNVTDHATDSFAICKYFLDNYQTKKVKK